MTKLEMEIPAELKDVTAKAPAKGSRVAEQGVRNAPVTLTPDLDDDVAPGESAQPERPAQVAKPARVDKTREKPTEALKAMGEAAILALFENPTNIAMVYGKEANGTAKVPEQVWVRDANDKQGLVLVPSYNGTSLIGFKSYFYN